MPTDLMRGVCTCGHEKGWHIGGAIGCTAGADTDDEGCPCLDFEAVHVHVAGQPPNPLDRCEECGHDLRELCHVRGADHAD